jgi:ABC-type transporter Mla subunit MlaD
MRRIAITALALAAASAFVFLAAGARSATTHPTYWVTLDNAFGLVDGADVKVAGVRAGTISGFKVDPKTYRALVGIKLDQKGFDQFRSDAFCQSSPQSLIGEYFIDCQPGAKGRLLKSGAVIPVTHTASTIPGDLLQDVLRLPYQQRLRIIINELGASVAGNGQNLNDALYRAVPALRETDRVLAILAQQNKVLAQLATNGDAVVTALARNHADVGRFVQTAAATATASANRRVALAQTFHKLPAFLAQLRPAMTALGQVAGQQGPAFANLNASANNLTRFLTNLKPFSDSSKQALASLGKASIVGRKAATAFRPDAAELKRFAAQAPEVGTNLRFILEHLDDPRYAVETDQRAAAQHPVDHRPNYTGLEALLQYLYYQTEAINIFTGSFHILKVSAFVDAKCSPYNGANTVNKGGFALYQQCSGNKIGPNSPGLYGQPDICDTGNCLPASAPRSATAASAGGSDGQGGGAKLVAASNGGAGGSTGGAAGPAIDLQKTFRQILGALPTLPGGAPASRLLSSQTTSGLLSYLFGG